MLHIVTRRSVLQKVRNHALALSLLVSTGFQVLFHSPPGVLFTFPSRYYALSVTGSYLALEGGPPCFPPDSSCPVVLWCRLSDSTLRIQASYLLWERFPSLFSWVLSMTCVGPQPLPTVVGRFGLLRFRSPLLTESFLLSFPPGTEMFQFPGFPRLKLWIHFSVTGHHSRRVSPFRYLWIKACLQLPTAFRSLPRLSSVSSAMASTLRPL